MLRRFFLPHDAAACHQHGGSTLFGSPASFGVPARFCWRRRQRSSLPGCWPTFRLGISSTQSSPATNVFASGSRLCRRLQPYRDQGAIRPAAFFRCHSPLARTGVVLSVESGSLIAQRSCCRPPLLARLVSATDQRCIGSHQQPLGTSGLVPICERTTRTRCFCSPSNCRSSSRWSLRSRTVRRQHGWQCFVDLAPIGSSATSREREAL